MKAELFINFKTVRALSRSWPLLEIRRRPETLRRTGADGERRVVSAPSPKSLERHRKRNGVGKHGEHSNRHVALEGKRRYAEARR